MFPHFLRPLFWDTSLDNFEPGSSPACLIARVLEFGNEKIITWLRDTFSETRIVEVLNTERRLSHKS